MFFLLGIVLLIFVPWPWNLVSATACLVLFCGELWFWNQRMRGRRKAVGAETLLGREAEVLLRKAKLRFYSDTGSRHLDRADLDQGVSFERRMSDHRPLDMAQWGLSPLRGLDKDQRNHLTVVDWRSHTDR